MQNLPMLSALKSLASKQGFLLIEVALSHCLVRSCSQLSASTSFTCPRHASMIDVIDDQSIHDMGMSQQSLPSLAMPFHRAIEKQKLFIRCCYGCVSVGLGHGRDFSKLIGQFELLR